MPRRRSFAWFLAASITSGVASGSSHHGACPYPFPYGGGSPGFYHHIHCGVSFGGGGWGLYGFPYYGGVGIFGPSYFTPSLQPAGPNFPPLGFDPGVLGGPMPGRPAPGGGLVPVRKVKRTDPVKVAQLVTFGDRLFRAGNLKRAGERYEQAARADPDVAAPRVGLAQVALVRGQFKESADQIRAAVTAEPGWLAKASDVQTLYAEPADFIRQISRLESHLLVEPGDRDAWLVLGAQLYLSGQTRRAADVFVRLSDREPDPALSAFLKATAPSDAVPR